MQKPSEPDAFAAAELADAIHAIVPIAGSYQGQGVRSQREAIVQSASAMFEEARGCIGNVRLEECVMLPGFQRDAFEKGGALIENRGVTGSNEVVDGGIGEPYTIVADASTNALSARRQLPVLHVALHELAARRAQEMLTSERRLRGHDRHPVL